MLLATSTIKGANKNVSTTKKGATSKDKITQKCFDFKLPLRIASIRLIKSSIKMIAVIAAIVCSTSIQLSLLWLI